MWNMRERKATALTKYVRMRLTEEQYADLEKQARAEDRDLGNMARQFVLEGIRSRVIKSVMPAPAYPPGKRSAK